MLCVPTVHGALLRVCRLPRVPAGPRQRGRVWQRRALRYPLQPWTAAARCQHLHQCTAVPGTYANASVERDPADPSTWAAPGCASCPSGKRADDATGAVCLPCFPGQFASSTGSVTCDVCPAGSYSAGFESTACAPCPTSGYCSSPGAGDEALAFTPCAQPKYTTIVHKYNDLSHAIPPNLPWQVP